MFTKYLNSVFDPFPFPPFAFPISNEPIDQVSFPVSDCRKLFWTSG